MPLRVCSNARPLIVFVEGRHQQQSSSTTVYLLVVIIITVRITRRLIVDNQSNIDSHMIRLRQECSLRDHLLLIMLLILIKYPNWEDLFKRIKSSQVPIAKKCHFVRIVRSIEPGLPKG